MQFQKMLAEVIGTFGLLFVGMMAIVHNPGLLGVAFAHGLIIAVLAMALGTVSGGQFNPAVSFGLSLAGKQSWADTAVCIVSQLVGAALGGFAAMAVAGHANLAKVGFSQPNIGAGFTSTGALIGEIIATFFLVLVVLKVAVRQGHVMGGLIVGLTITAGILAIGPVSGAALNPARAFGAAVVSGDWASMWIYWVGPLIGAALAAFVALYMWRLPQPAPATN